MIHETSVRLDGIPIAEADIRLEHFPGIDDPSRGRDVPALQEIVRGIRPGEIVLNARFVDGIPNGAAAELTEIPELGRTREMSQNEIVFGQLLVDSDVGETAALVAAKPLPDTVAAREYAVSDYIYSGNVPRCDTFQPLGIMRGFDGQALLLTEYMHSVKSSDNVLWKPNAIHNPLVVNTVLGRAGIAMAILHDNEWVHGDPQAKNMVANWIRSRRADMAEAAQETVFVNDLEEAEPIAHLPASERGAKKRRDLDIFIWSAFRLKRQGHSMPEDYSEQLKDSFGLVYAGSRSRGAVAEESAIGIDEISDLIDQEEINLDKKYPLFARPRR